jgi:mannonate dehydratase
MTKEHSPQAMDDTTSAATERRAMFERLPLRTALATFALPTDERLRFMKQLGVDDTIIWGNTFRAPSALAPGAASGPPELTFKELITLRNRIEAHGLRFFAIENVPLSFYDKIILGLPGKEVQIEHMKNTVRAMGRVGIPILGYNWIVSGVWRTSFSYELRGGAKGTGFDLRDVAGAPNTHGRDYSEQEIWDNYAWFLDQILPVAEAEGVSLALHPNDPPVEKIGGFPFLFRDLATFKKGMEIHPSPNHGLIYCLGNWCEMGAPLLETIRYWGEQKKLFYVHFQAVTGKVPTFHETFIDTADYDAYEILTAFNDAGCNGVMIPGHVPQMEGDIEWRTPESAQYTPYNHPMGGFRARAYTIGYLKGMLHALRGKKAYE